MTTAKKISFDSTGAPPRNMAMRFDTKPVNIRFRARHGSLSSGNIDPSVAFEQRNEISAEQLMLSNRLEVLRNAMIEVMDESSTQDWDGYESHSVNQESLRYAYTFLQDLDRDVPIPILGCEPTGKIGMEWNTDGHSLAAAFDVDGVLKFGSITLDSKIITGKTVENLMIILKKMYS